MRSKRKENGKHHKWQGWGRKFLYVRNWHRTTDNMAIVFAFGLVHFIPVQKSPEDADMSSVKLIHKQTMATCGNNPPLNGCHCPKCGSEKTYDVQRDYNYYFGCVDCEQVVAIWIESDVSDVSGEPWFVIPDEYN